jgi:hypothetical protein
MEATQIEEQWLPLPEYEGLYEISSFGRVKTLRRQGSSERILPPNSREGTNGVVYQVSKNSIRNHINADEIAIKLFHSTVISNRFNEKFFRLNNGEVVFNPVSVRAFDYEGYYIGDFSTIKEASEILGVVSNQISHVCNLRSNHTGKIQFRYLKDISSGLNILIQRLGSLKSIPTISKLIIIKKYKGRVVTTYHGYTEAVECTGIIKTDIFNAVERGHEVKGFTFEKQLKTTTYGED